MFFLKKKYLTPCNPHSLNKTKKTMSLPKNIPIPPPLFFHCDPCPYCLCKDIQNGVAVDRVEQGMYCTLPATRMLLRHSSSYFIYHVYI